MARAGVAGLFSLARICSRNVPRWPATRAWFSAALVVAGLTFAGACRADPIKGEATFSASGGFARLVFKLAEDVPSEVTTAGSILVIRFGQPEDIPIDRCAQGERQHHDRGRTGVHRSAARDLDRPAAEPSSRGGSRTGRTCARGG